EVRHQSSGGGPATPEFCTEIFPENCCSTAFAKQQLRSAEAFSRGFSELPLRPSFSQVSSGAPKKRLAPAGVFNALDHQVQSSVPCWGSAAGFQPASISSGPASVRAFESARAKASRNPERSSLGFLFSRVCMLIRSPGGRPVPLKVVSQPQDRLRLDLGNTGDVKPKNGCDLPNSELLAVIEVEHETFHARHFLQTFGNQFFELGTLQNASRRVFLRIGDEMDQAAGVLT